MSLKLKVFEASKSIYEGLKECFLEKVKSITEKILQMSKKLKEDKCDLDNSMHFSTSGIIEVDDRENLGKISLLINKLKNKVCLIQDLAWIDDFYNEPITYYII